MNSNCLLKSGTIKEKVESQLDKLDKDIEYAVGFSCGIDSTALLIAMLNKGFKVTGWNIDHAWREECEFTKNFIEEFSKKHNVKVLSERLKHARSNKNREAVARKARYTQFEVWANETGVSNVCLGHHIEDQAETVYMRLLKGSGVRGCAGIRFNNKMGELNVFRPFLSLSKKELSEYLELNNVNWIEDPSNKDCTIMRNKVRNQTFPFMKEKGLDAINLFNRIGQVAQKAEIIIDEILDQYSYEVIDKKAIKFKWSDWESMNDEIKKMFLQKIGKELFDNSFSFGKRHLKYANEWKGEGSIDLTKSKLKRKKKEMILSKTM